MILFVTSLGLLLASCGGDDDSNEPETPGSTSTNPLVAFWTPGGSNSDNFGFALFGDNKCYVFNDYQMEVCSYSYDAETKLLATTALSNLQWIVNAIDDNAWSGLSLNGTSDSFKNGDYKPFVYFMSRWKGRNYENGLTVYFDSPYIYPYLSSDFKKPNVLMITIRKGDSDYKFDGENEINIIEITGVGKVVGEFNCKFYSGSTEKLGDGKIRFHNIDGGKLISWDDMPNSIFEISGPTSLSFKNSGRK